MNPTLPVVWTNDDIHFGRAPNLRRQLEFLDRHGIPGVFFVIPNMDGPLDEDEELLATIGAAKKNGHEFYQHGYLHTAFECGIPEMTMLDFDPVAKRRFDEERDIIEAGHTFEAQVAMLEKGRRIWRSCFGEDSKGFRPGWGAYGTNLYRALAALGFEWISCRIPCITSWDWNHCEWESPMHFREKIPTHPVFLRHGIWEFPLAGDYAFRVPNDPEKMDKMVDLGLREFETFYERRDPMLMVCHFHGLEFDGGGETMRKFLSAYPGNKVRPEYDKLAPHPQGTGYAIHEKLIPALLQTKRASFVGMQEVVSHYTQKK